jgi:predicted flap endonuclease-1-like 5' DNA nuclease
MAQQYRRAAKPGGFNPINVGGQAIARMREESARVAEGLRTARAAEIRNRETNLAQMKEDARATERATAANVRIQTQNTANELKQMSLDTATASAQFAADQKAAADVFKSVSGLSKVAAKKFEEIGEQQFKEDAQRAIDSFDPNSDAVIQQIVGESQLDAQEELRQGAIDNVYANGGNPLAVAQAREMSSGTRYGLDQARANYLWTVVYPERIQRAKLETPEAFEKSSSAAAFLVNARREFVEETGLINIKPEMMRDGLTSVQNFHNTILSQTRQVEEKNIYAKMDQDQMQILSQNPGSFNINITKAFRTWARNPSNLFTGALSKFESLATMRKPNGEFMFSMEQLSGAVLKEGGKPFILDNPERFAAMQAKRVESQNTFNRAALTTENLTYQKKEQDVLKFLANNNTQANANYAVQYFRKTFGKVPQSILTFQKSYTGDAIEKAQAIEKLKAIPDGFITQEAVDTLAGLDYNEGKALEARREVQERPYKFELYKKTFDSYKTIANGVTAVGTQKPNTPESVFFTTVLQGTFKRYYDEARESGLEGQPAVNYAKDKVQAMLDDAKTNKDALFYRKVSGPGGVVSFPNLVKGQQGKIDEALLFRANLRKEINAKGIETVINTQGTIINSQEEAAELSRQVRQPGFILPGKFMIPTSASKNRAHDPMVTFNAQLAAWGEKPIPPPPSLDHVNKNVSPELQALLYNNPSPNRSARSLGSTNVFTPAIVPNNLGPVIQTDAQAAGINPAYSAALSDVMGNYSSDMTVTYAARLRETGSPVAAAIGMLADQGYVGQALMNKQRDFVISMYKYGGGLEALNMMKRGGFTERTVQIVHGNEAMISYRGGADGNAVFYDAKLHSGANEHVHAQLKTKEDVAALKQKASTTIDPFSGKPYRITSELRPGDPGAHGSGLALDIAPPVELPVEYEPAWYHEFFRQMGMNPFQIK